MALLCLGYDPTITNSVWLVKVAIRSRRQSIWVTYTSRRYTAFYTGFRCMLQLYIDLALSRLARHAIQPIQLYSYTAIQLYTLYSKQHYTASLCSTGLRACLRDGSNELRPPSYRRLRRSTGKDGETGRGAEGKMGRRERGADGRRWETGKTGRRVDG